MALDAGAVVAHLNADISGWMSGLATANAALKSTADLTEQKIGRINNVLQSVGKAFTGMGIGIVVAEGASTGFAASFDTAMRKVNSISDLTEKSLKNLSQDVLNLTKNGIPQAPQTLAQGLYDIASSGFQGADGLTVLKASAVAATAGMTDTATAAKVITGTLNAYGDGAAKAKHVSDVLFQTVKLGVVEFPQLAQGIGEVNAIAAQSGVSLEETGAAIATLTYNGIPAAEAMTSLRALFVQMLSPTKELEKAIKAHGYSSGMAMMQTKGLAGVLQFINSEAANNKDRFAQLFPEVRALQGAMSLAGNDGKTFGDMLAKMGKASEGGGAAQKSFNEIMKSSGMQLELAKQKLLGAAVALGTKLLPYLRYVVDGFTNFVALLQHVNPVLLLVGAGLMVLTGMLLQMAVPLANAYLSFKSWQSMLGLQKEKTAESIAANDAHITSIDGVVVAEDKSALSISAATTATETNTVKIWENVAALQAQSKAALTASSTSLVPSFNGVAKSKNGSQSPAVPKMKAIMGPADDIIDAEIISAKTMGGLEVVGGKSFGIWSKVAQLFTKLPVQIALIAAAVAGAIAGLVYMAKHSEAVKKALTSMWNDVKGPLTELGASLKNAFTGLWQAVKPILQGIGILLGTALLGALYLITKTIKNIANIITPFLNTIGDLLKGLVALLSGNFSNALHYLKASLLDFGNIFIGVLSSLFGWVPGIGKKLEQAHDTLTKLANKERQLAGETDKTTKAVKENTTATEQHAEATSGDTLAIGQQTASAAKLQNSLQSLATTAKYTAMQVQSAINTAFANNKADRVGGTAGEEIRQWAQYQAQIVDVMRRRAEATDAYNASIRDLKAEQANDKDSSKTPEDYANELSVITTQYQAQMVEIDGDAKKLHANFRAISESIAWKKHMENAKYLLDIESESANLSLKRATNDTQREIVRSKLSRATNDEQKQSLQDQLRLIDLREAKELELHDRQLRYLADMKNAKNEEERQSIGVYYQMDTERINNTYDNMEAREQSYNDMRLENIRNAHSLELQLLDERIGKTELSTLREFNKRDESLSVAENRARILGDIIGGPYRDQQQLILRNSRIALDEEKRKAEAENKYNASIAKINADTSIQDEKLRDSRRRQALDEYEKDMESIRHDVANSKITMQFDWTKSLVDSFKQSVTQVWETSLFKGSDFVRGIGEAFKNMGNSMNLMNALQGNFVMPQLAGAGANFSMPQVANMNGGNARQPIVIQFNGDVAGLMKMISATAETTASDVIVKSLRNM